MQATTINKVLVAVIIIMCAVLLLLINNSASIMKRCNAHWHKEIERLNCLDNDYNVQATPTLFNYTEVTK